MSVEYDNYIREHKENVQKGFDWLCNHTDICREAWLMGEDPHHLIEMHDESKYFPEEYDAYDKYFYGGNRSYKVVQDFNYAWLHHIHHNPHHWQYWVLQHDDEPEEVLEMPYGYVIEMICDWWSFSWKTGNLYEIFDWYEKHKGMKLHEKTRKFVEDILDRMKNELDKENNKENI